MVEVDKTKRRGQDCAGNYRLRLLYNRPDSADLQTTMDATASSNSQIFSINPYEDHPSLTRIEADVLWEYAKLNQHIKDVRYHHQFFNLVLDHDLGTGRVPIPLLLQLVIQTRTLSETPDESMLKRLRILERKMGLVLTLVRDYTLS